MATRLSYLGVGCTRCKPSRAYRPALWENMLGTVYALNGEGECRYFDYDYEGARQFAGITGATEARVYRVNRDLDRGYVRSGATHANPRPNQVVLWIQR